MPGPPSLSITDSSPPMSARLKALSGSVLEGRAFTREVIPRGILCHDNYSEFMARQLRATLAPVLSKPQYARLLDRLESADARISRQMAKNASGANFSSWLPGARDEYRRELTLGHYMTAVADELGELSKEAARRSGGRLPTFRSQTEAEVIEARLLATVATFLNEFKRSVRSASVLHVNADYSKEEGRRYEQRAGGSRPQPGQEVSYIGGVSARAGGGFAVSNAVKLSATGTVKYSTTTRDIDDFDRDNNRFEEEGLGASAEMGAAIKGIFDVGVGANVDLARGRYYESDTPEKTFAVANLATFRNPGIFGGTISAGKTRRQVSEFGHGLALAARKVVGGGRDLPLDAVKWAGSGKEEKGKYNRQLLASLARDIEIQASLLADAQGVARPPRGLGAAASEYFPPMSDHIASAGDISQIRPGPRGDIAKSLGTSREPISIPAMQAKPGAPWLKKPYEGITASVTGTARVGFRPLVLAGGPAGLHGPLTKVKNFLPSAGLSHGVAYNRRVLEVTRQAPMSETLAPLVVLNTAKGITQTDAVAAALEHHLSSDRRGTRGSRSDSGGTAHPGLAVLRRFELAPHGIGSAAGANASDRSTRDHYLASIDQRLAQRSLHAPDVVLQVSRNLDAIAREYAATMADAYDAKEVHRSGDSSGRGNRSARLAGGQNPSLEAINARAWAGWHGVDGRDSRRSLDGFIAHSLAQYELAFTRMKYELTLAKQHMHDHANGLDAASLDRIRADCAEADRKSLRMDELVRELKAPLDEDTATGYGFYNANGVAARKMVTANSTFSATAGLGSTVAGLVGGGANFGGLRGPEVQLGVQQQFNNVLSHPNLMRAGQFYTATVSLKAGAGSRTVLGAMEKALRQAARKERLAPEFVASVWQKIQSDVRSLFDPHTDTLAVVGRSSGLAVEMSYAQAPAIGKEKPAAFLRYIKVLGQTTYDNSIRSPDVLSAAGIPAQLNLGAIDVTNETLVRRCLHGNNVRHLILEYTGPMGLKSILKPDPATTRIDFEAARAALLDPVNSAALGGWFHGASPLVDVVDKYLRHHARTGVDRGPAGKTIDPDDEFDYIDLDSEEARRVEHDEPRLRRFAAGSRQDPLLHEFGLTRREQLRREAIGWGPRSLVAGSRLHRSPRDHPDAAAAGAGPSVQTQRWHAERLVAVRNHLASLASDVERVDYLTRTSAGQAVLQQAIAVLDAHAAWSVHLRLMFGYPGKPNHASIDQLKLRSRAPAATPGMTAEQMQAPAKRANIQSSWL